MNKLLIAILATISIALYACRHTPIEQPVTGPPGPGTGSNSGGGTGGSSKVCFTKDILPIFQTNCAKSGCHDAASRQDGYVLDSYDNLFKEDGKFEDDNIQPGRPFDSDLYQMIIRTDNKRMPKPPNPALSDAQIRLINRWITEGAYETTCQSSCDSTVTTVSFQNHIQPILQNNCTGCHSAGAPSGGVNLSNYAGVKPHTTGGVNSLLYGVVAHLPGIRSPMPKIADPNDPTKTIKLPACEIALIRKWVVAGAPNN